jgi:uncharacterized membrane protein YbaN (DUF454 family)
MPDRTANPKPKKSLWRLITGWSMIVVGIAGCLLPIAPGLPFLIGGLALLAAHYPWARTALQWVKQAPHRMCEIWTRMRGTEPAESLSITPRS